MSYVFSAPKRGWLNRCERGFVKLALIGLLLWLVSLSSVHSAQAAALPPGVAGPPRQYCYAFNDDGKTLVLVNRLTGAVAWSGAVNNTQPNANEATTFDPASNTLYIVDQANDPDRLMRVDLTGATPNAVAIGTNLGVNLRGSAGNFTPGATNGATGNSRVTGITMNPFTGVLWALTINNRLFQVNKNSGAYIANSFGANTDYIVVNTPVAEDLTFSPLTGELWVTYENPNSSGPSYIQRISPTTGATIGNAIRLDGGNPSGVEGEVEGLSFATDGKLYGVTGDGGTIDGRFFEIPIPTSGNSTTMLQRAELPRFDTRLDYESTACLLEKPVNLQVNKRHAPEPVVAGSPIQYTIVVTNAGPFSTTYALLTDTVPAAITGITWRCSTSGAGNVCVNPASGGVGNNIVQQFSLAYQGVLTIQITGTVAADANASILNSVRVDPLGEGEAEADPSNNVYTDTATLATDLMISKTDQQTTYRAGSTTTYIIVVSNRGPTLVRNAQVTDTLPSQITGATWTCSAAAGSSCSSTSGAGSISTTATLAGNSQVTYTLVATIAANATGDLTNSARVNPPLGVSEATLANNQASDVDQLAQGVAILSASKRDALQQDGNGNSVADAGEVIRYTVVINNSGAAPANQVVLVDQVDANTSLIVGSVTSSQGVVELGNSAGNSSIRINIGTLPSNSSATVTFDVRIANPLPAGVTRLRNQGTISSNLTPLTTDDPDTPLPGDATETPLIGNPKLSAIKSDTVVVDADQSGSASPGDTLEYRITIVNNGNQDALAAQVNDELDANVTLLAGSVETSQGTVLIGNNIGDQRVQVDVGVIAANGDSVILSFWVTINKPLPANATTIFNQALVSTLNAPPVLTDDPDTLKLDDPTETPVVAAARLNASKRAQLLVDADASGAPSPGDTVIYHVAIVNNGDRQAAGLIFMDSVDVNTTLVPESVQTSQGVVIAGNNPGDANVLINIGTLAGGGGLVNISFKVTINNPFPPAVTVIKNQGIVKRSDGADLPTNDPSTLAPDDETVTALFAEPRLVLSKKDILVIDADTVVGPSAGDTLLYQITLENNGNTTAQDVVLKDTPDTNTTLVVGSVQTNRGTVVKGNTAGDTSVEINLGALPPGEKAQISLRVRINDNISARTLLNQAIVSLSNPGANRVEPTVPSDDPDTESREDATATVITTEPSALEENAEPATPTLRVFLPVVVKE